MFSYDILNFASLYIGPYPSSPRAEAWLLGAEDWLESSGHVRSSILFSVFALYQPVFATVQMVFDFSEQFVRMEAENAQLRKELSAAKIAASQIEHSQKVAEEAWQANEDLKKELAQVKDDLKNEV